MLKFKILIGEVNRMSPKVWEWNNCDLNKTAQSAAVDSMIRRRWLIALGHDSWRKFLLPAVYPLAVRTYSF